MSKQYHYVVVYDTKTKEFRLDPDTLDVNFPNGEVWDEKAEEWEGFRNTPELEDDFLSIEDRLARILDGKSPLSTCRECLNDFSTEELSDFMVCQNCEVKQEN